MSDVEIDYDADPKRFELAVLMHYRKIYASSVSYDTGNGVCYRNTKDRKIVQGLDKLIGKLLEERNNE